MTRLVLARRLVLERRRWLLGWSIGIIGTIGLTVAFWPALRDKSGQMNDMLDKLPESLKSLFGLGGGLDPFSPIGYLSSKVYSLTLPVMLLIAAIGAAASLGGDEEHGVLETTYALPLSRRRVVLERWTAVTVLVAVLALASLATVVASSALVDLGVGLSQLVWPAVGAAVLAWAVAGVAIAAAAASGRRSVAISVASVVAVASYIITSLADAGIGFFRALKPVSLFTHYDVVHTLVTGRPSWSLLILGGVALCALAFALWAVDRRDLRAG